jgi:peptidoglycan/LPS O-acetylase OafA/YrhL
MRLSGAEDMYDVIYAIVACGAMLAAVLIAAFAYRLNEKWTEKEAKWLEIAEEQLDVLKMANCNSEKQNKLVQQMGEEWLKFYHELRREQNGRD